MMKLLKKMIGDKKDALRVKNLREFAVFFKQIGEIFEKAINCGRPDDIIEKQFRNRQPLNFLPCADSPPDLPGDDFFHHCLSHSLCFDSALMRQIWLFSDDFLCLDEYGAPRCVAGCCNVPLRPGSSVVPRRSAGLPIFNQ